MQSSQHIVFYLRILWVTAFLFVSNLQITSQSLTPSEKKVILIFKFAEFVHWENEDQLDTLKLAIFSDDNDFVKDLSIFETVKINGKVVALNRIYNVNNLGKSQIIVLSDDKNYLMDEVFEKITGKQTLLISDGCKKQDLIMINFIYKKDGKIDFEINKANILKENMTVNPELLLLGGSEIDIASLYKESQKSLTEIRDKVSDLEDKYNLQQKELNSRDKELTEKNREIKLRNDELEKQKTEFINLNKKISQQDKKLQQEYVKLEDLQKQLENKGQQIEESNRILSALNNEISSKQEKIEIQEKELITYESTVDQQKSTIYLAVSLLGLVLILVVIVYRGFINKKKTAKKLEEKEAEIRMLFDIAPLPVIMTEVSTGKAIYINQLGVDMFQLKNKDDLNYISAQRFYVDLKDRDYLIQKLKNENKVNNLELQLKNRKSEVFYGSVSGLITTYEKKTVFFLAIKDITDIRIAVNELNNYKNRLEDIVKERSRKLLESQKRFKDMAELLPETIFEMDKEGRLSFINNRGMEMFEISQDDIEQGLYLSDLIAGSEGFEINTLVNRFGKEEQLQTNEFQFLRRGKKNFPGIIYMNNTNGKNGIRIIRGIIVDISERKDLERKILNTMLETEEKERKRFAEDLHDGLGSLLSSLNLYVDMIENPELKEGERVKLFSTLRNIIDESIKSSKEISNNLRPSTLSRFGLTGSLESFCTKINETKKLNITFDHSNFTTKLSTNTENALYRIVNELINNTLKYASAKNAWLKLEKDDQVLTLNYKDDGIGFDKEKALKSEGMGLKNIYTRVNSIHGNCEIKSRAGEGINVIITVNVPLEADLRKN